MKFHDGSALTPAAVVAALPASADGWTVGPIGDGIVIRSEHPLPGLLAELAEARNAIVLRAPDGALSGTGPFRITQWEPERRAVFSANEDYWDGRPFLDAIAVQMGRTPQQQTLDLELGRADLAEISAGDVRRASQGGMKVWTSAPVTLLALVFDPAADARLREALALSIDRAAIQNVLLQKQGEPAGGLLPEWLSGYAFLFRTARVRQQVSTAAELTLGYGAGDALARSIADRIAVNAREAGIRLQVSAQAAKPDVRLLRARVRSVEPGAALASLAPALGLGELPGLADAEACYAAERALVDDFRVVPLVHLPELYGSRTTVRTWQTPGLLKTGEWRLEDVWLAAERP